MDARFTRNKIFFALFPVLAFFFIFPKAIFASQVRIEEKGRGWVLFSEDRPFYIKGVGCSAPSGSKGEDYLLMARDLGANAVRTWGEDQGSRNYFDRCAQYGLRVAAGIWLEPADGKKVSYCGPTDYKARRRREILDYVERFKNHPALLLWVVGNETIQFTKNDEERVFFSRFLEDLVKEIHRTDPNHPVVYASCSYFDLPYLKQFVPSLDAIGANVYGSPKSFQSRWEDMGFNCPYLLTEYGPPLPGDQPTDANGQPMELEDYQKALAYKNMWEQIKGAAGDNLGGFAFHLGEDRHDTMTWWNINQNEFKKKSYRVLSDLYHEAPISPSAPRLLRMVLSKASHLNAGESVDVRMELKVPAEGRFEYRLSKRKGNLNEWAPLDVIGRGSKVRIRAPSEKGIYRLYGFVRTEQGDIASLSRSIAVD